jgi:phosphoenolpyruvate-protein phosphotransferase
MDNEVFRVKSLDIQDVFFRLLRNLLEIEHVRASSLRQIDEKVILVADKFLPSDIVLLEKDKLLGIVLEEGSTVSHVAIIAKSLGVPAIINVAGVTAMVRSATVMIADGFTGKVIINPDTKRLAAYKTKAKAKRGGAIRVTRRRVCATTDGRRIALQANAGNVGEIKEAMRNGAEGIGLVRSELFYLSRDRAPTVEEESAFYESLVDACSGRPLTIRLLDVGGDKSPPYLTMPSEDCPQLGAKGIRYLLQSPDLFNRHLLAILRACRSARVNILAPFVSLPREIEQTKALVTALGTTEGIDLTTVSVGAMIEVPSAALAIESFLKAADFFSIGTNDLVQYIFAASRENGMLEEYRTASLPLILSIIHQVAACAERHHKALSVCGEIASHPETASLLVGAGVTSLSLQPSALPAVHRAISGSSYSSLRAGAAKIMAYTHNCMHPSIGK